MNKNLVIGVLIASLGVFLNSVVIDPIFNEESDISQRNILKNFKAEEAFRGQIGKLPHFSSFCFPTHGHICADGGCEIAKDLGTSFSLINNFDIGNSKISRCDSKGCDTYDATYYGSGFYENYQPKQPRGFFLKKETKLSVEQETTSYIEVVTLGMSSIFYSGYCRDAQ